MDNEKRNSGFNTPQGYFDTFGDRLKQRLSAEDEQSPSESGFRVPDGYFESFGEKLKEKMAEDDNKVIQLKPQRDFYYAAASVVALFLMLGLWFFNRPEQAPMEDLAFAEIEAYFLQQQVEFTTEELTAFVPTEALEMEEFLGDPLKDEQILEYLDQNLDDIDDLNISYDEIQ